jgi:putative SOS response-associated peptidase YedK
MCGRYAITLPPEAVRAYFAYGETPNFPPRYNVAPTRPIPVVIAEPQGSRRIRHFKLMRWGFLPGLAKDPRDFPLIVNARAETALEDVGPDA